MVYQDISTVNQTIGFSENLIYVNNITDTFFSGMLIFSLFAIFILASYRLSKTANDNPNLFHSFAAGSFAALVCTFILSLIDNFIPLYQLLIAVTVFLISVIILFIDRD